MWVVCDVFDGVGYVDIVIFGYVVKYVLVFYGLFCEVVDFLLCGDWCSY